MEKNPIGRIVNFQVFAPEKWRRVPPKLRPACETSTYTTYIYTVSQKNVPPLACYTFDAHEWILIFFGTNVTDKVSNQKTLYYAPEITCASALPVKTGKHENHIFHSIGLHYTHNAPVRCLPERKNCHL